MCQGGWFKIMGHHHMQKGHTHEDIGGVGVIKTFETLFKMLSVVFYISVSFCCSRVFGFNLDCIPI